MPSAGWDAAQAIGAAPIRPFVGRVWRVHWRQVAADDWGLSLRTSGRYHRGLDLFRAEQAFPVLYTSLAPEIAIWEMVRRSAARNLVYLKNNVLSELAVDLARVVDVTDPSVIGLNRADVTGPDHDPCQAIAAAAVARRCDGLLVPSAAMPGTNLVILPGNLPAPVPIRVLRSTELPLETLAAESQPGDRPSG